MKRLFPTHGLSERGGIIIVALMVLLALSGIALLGVRTTYHEIRSAGNHSFDRMGYQITDGAVATTVTYATSSPSAFLGVAYSNGMTFQASHLGDIYGNLWDLSPGGSLGFAGNNLGTPDFWTNVDQPITLNFYPGSSVGEFCAEKHTWRTHGTIGNSSALDQASQLDRPPFGEKVILTRWMVGPLDCAGGNP
jgi:hypothetical protein